jgi:Na+/melibiose symporter-like transporter
MASQPCTSCRAIIPDAIEYRLQTGKRNEAFYSLITRAEDASSSAGTLALPVLQFSGYMTDGSAAGERHLGIRIIAGPIPAIALGLAILFTALFPLGRDDYKEINRQLEERRQANLEPAD